VPGLVFGTNPTNQKWEREEEGGGLNDCCRMGLLNFAAALCSTSPDSYIEKYSFNTINVLLVALGGVGKLK
jgi:hypothetical protein